MIEKKSEQQKIVVDLTELEKKYSDLKTHFGEENIQIDYYGDSFNKIRITHIPSGKIQLGEKHNTQIENAVQALEKLKMKLISKPKLEIKSNSILVEFLENPIDLQEFKRKKGKHFTTSVTGGTEYYFTPKIQDSIFYVYYYPDLDKEPIDIDQIIVFKSGKNKHTYQDKTEVIIEIRVFNEDSDLGKANLVGLSKTELESEFGNDYLTFNNGIAYSNKNKILTIELDNSKVKSFRYIKLNTENVDQDLIRQIVK
ncbi:hypothetical protein Q4Q34_04915 [Flavivirga abyssicola]|uniref:hypothetical protein n=1 Tax=Flavivirga abyssicola TaxID=3063533 RepID=UPI0026E0292C|nr:hypothetical protein [Flavivirga sp. MEBiC07777]WVK14368.1 hypothetical protein Q4Q34_04915 [Flavivirga sp. MEBiC07777]